VLGLLGDSKHTKRYSRLQNFVREGSSKAEIRVTLQNTGPEAFRPEVYGSSITFQRFIHKAGGTSFLLLDQNEVMKYKDHPARTEGRRVLDEFKINPGNPLIILQQEQAKEFLSDLSPASLYTFFQTATLLKPCLDQYIAAEQDLKAAKRAVDNKKVSLENLKKDLEAKKDQLRKCKRSNELSEELQRLKVEYCWAMVQDCKEKTEELQSNIEEEEETKISQVCSVCVFYLFYSSLFYYPG
jgi:chromosome segregation ATPase